MNATVELWGWRARLRLARGQTITDVTAKVPALESGLSTQCGAVRACTTPDDLANRCELHVLDRDPHTDAIPWPGPSVTSITEPVDLGLFEDAEPRRVLVMRRHDILGGVTRPGESGGLNELMTILAACRDAVSWAIDLKRGMELKPPGLPCGPTTGYANSPQPGKAIHITLGLWRTAAQGGSHDYRNIGVRTHARPWTDLVTEGRRSR
jgi:hypothetical protein